MRRCIGLTQIVDVIGGHQLETRPLRQLCHARIHFGQFCDAGFLHLQIDVFSAENGRQSFHLSIRSSRLPVLQGTRQAAAGAPGQTDEPPGIFLQNRVIDTWLVVVTLEKGKAPQLQQISVPVVVSSQKGEMPTLLVLPLLAEAVFDYIGLQTDDGLDSVTAALLIELDNPRQHSVIGDGKRLHSKLCRPFYQVIDLAGTVKRRVVSMNVQMAEAGRRLRRRRLGLLFQYGLGRS